MLNSLYTTCYYIFVVVVVKRNDITLFFFFLPIYNNPHFKIHSTTTTTKLNSHLNKIFTVEQKSF